MVAIRDDKFYKFTLFELYKSLLNLVGEIKNYLRTYRDSSLKPAECDNYARNIDGYLNMIVRNNRIVAVKYAGR